MPRRVSERISPAALGLLGLLQQQAGHGPRALQQGGPRNDPTCWRQHDLARAMGLSLRHVQRLLRDLRLAGYVEMVKEPFGRRCSVQLANATRTTAMTGPGAPGRDDVDGATTTPMSSSPAAERDKYDIDVAYTTPMSSSPAAERDKYDIDVAYTTPMSYLSSSPAAAPAPGKPLDSCEKMKTFAHECNGHANCSAAAAAAISFLSEEERAAAAAAARDPERGLLALGLSAGLVRACLHRAPELAEAAAVHCTLRFRRELPANQAGYFRRIFATADSPERDYGFFREDGLWYPPEAAKVQAPAPPRPAADARRVDAARRRQQERAEEARRLRAAEEELAANWAAWEALPPDRRTAIEAQVRRRFGPLFPPDKTIGNSVSFRVECFAEMRRCGPPGTGRPAGGTS